MLYRDEKLKRIIHGQMKALWKTAAAVRERTCWLGGLAVLGWMVCITHLPPVQRAKSIVPHFVAICAAYSIGKTVEGSLRKASTPQQMIIGMVKSLKKATTADELYQIHRELGKLENQYIFRSNRQKD